MSTVLSFTCIDGFVLCTDAQSVYRDENGFCKETSTGKIMRIGQHDLALAHSGSRKIRDQVLSFLELQNIDSLDSQSMIKLVAESIDLAYRQVNEVTGNDVIEMETGFIVCGFIEKVPLSYLVTLKGELFEISRSAIMGAGAPYVKSWIDKRLVDVLRVREVFPIAVEAIWIASRSLYSNDVALPVIILPGMYYDFSESCLQEWKKRTDDFRKSILNLCPK